MAGVIVAWCAACVSAGALVACGVVLCRVSRACVARRLSERMRGSAANAPGGIGVSVLLCGGAFDAAQVEALLAEEYAFCEVIAVVDRRRRAALCTELIARYGLISVAPPDAARALYRSGRRNFRRFVLLDRAEGDVAGDCAAALRVAAYDYVLPLYGATMLRPGAIRRLVAAIGERPAGRTELVRTRVGPAVRLYARETAAELGFGPGTPRRIARAARVALWEPLAVRSGGLRRSVRTAAVAAGAAAALCATVAALRYGCWPAAAAASAAACCLATLLYVRQAAETASERWHGALVRGRRR